MPDATSRWPWLPRWIGARWRRATPGPYGLLALAAYPLLFVAPLEATGLFPDWQEGASRLLGLGVPLLALTLLRDIGSASPAEFWLHQKGVSLAEWAWTRLVAELALGAAVVAWWTVAFTIVARMHDIAMGVQPLLLLVLTLWLFYAVVSVLCLVLGATGYPRAVDLSVLILILTLVAPVLTSFVAPWVSLVLRTVLPPLVPVQVFRDALAAGLPWRDVLRPLLHIGSWCVATLALASWLLERRVPASGPPK